PREAVAAGFARFRDLEQGSLAYRAVLVTPFRPRRTRGGDGQIDILGVRLGHPGEHVSTPCRSMDLARLSGDALHPTAADQHPPRFCRPRRFMPVHRISLPW